LKVGYTRRPQRALDKHPKVRQWLARHPRWTFHFTPTSASWLNAVEGFFAKLSRRRLKRGVFLSVVDLQAAINRFVEHNAEPKPFTWTADPDKNIQAVRRGHQVLDSIQRRQNVWWAVPVLRAAQVSPVASSFAMHLFCRQLKSWSERMRTGIIAILGEIG
jgi:hypothetical protein